MYPHLQSRREMLRSAAAGFGWLAFNGLFAARAAEQNPLAPKKPHHAPRAKRVIFLFMCGGPSQVDSFDYKPALTKQHNVKTNAAAADSPVYYQSPWEFQERGCSGLPVSALFPHIAEHADDLCVINSMHTDHNAHPQAILQMNTGSFLFPRPSVGSWVTYGLGTENQSLPGFVTINPEFSGGGALKHSSGFLPAACAGMQIGEGGGGGAAAQSLKELKLPFMRNPVRDTNAQRRQLDLLAKLNAEHLKEDPTNQALEGMMQSAELAFSMQREMPEVTSIAKESPKTLEQYGIGGGKKTDHFGRACLMARRFSEAGVRFVQVNHTFWDDHTDIISNHPKHAGETDQPVGALLADLKQRGLLEDTLVLWGGEFGRPPLLNKNKGRDHNNVGFTMWLAGGGTRGGLRYGSTDETGAKAVDDKVHLHDLHATMLHLLGLDHELLTYRYSGRDFRLTDVAGKIVRGILA